MTRSLIGAHDMASVIPIVKDRSRLISTGTHSRVRVATRYLPHLVTI
jgi:hypothetical protein